MTTATSKYSDTVDVSKYADVRATTNKNDTVRSWGQRRMIESEQGESGEEGDG